MSRSHSSLNRSLYQQHKRLSQDTQDRALDTFLATQGDGSGPSKRKFTYTNPRERSTRRRQHEEGSEGGLGENRDAGAAQTDFEMQEIVSIRPLSPSKHPDTRLTTVGG